MRNSDGVGIDAVYPIASPIAKILCVINSRGCAHVLQRVIACSHSIVSVDIQIITCRPHSHKSDRQSDDDFEVRLDDSVSLVNVISADVLSLDIVIISDVGAGVINGTLGRREC